MWARGVALRPPLFILCFYRTGRSPAHSPAVGVKGRANSADACPGCGDAATAPKAARSSFKRGNLMRLRWGWYPYPQRALRGPEPLRAQRSEEHSLPSLHGPRERQREAESLRNGDAHGARLRSEAPRPRRVALLYCCFLRCTGKLRGSLSLRRRAERKIC